MYKYEYLNFGVYSRRMSTMRELEYFDSRCESNEIYLPSSFSTASWAEKNEENRPQRSEHKKPTSHFRTQKVTSCTYTSISRIWQRSKKYAQELIAEEERLDSI
jgi:hypothetical protein